MLESTVCCCIASLLRALSFGKAACSDAIIGCAGQFPSLKDWETHLTTIFPEVRLKRYMEMRGADGGSREAICALPALWAGLLYDR